MAKVDKESFTLVSSAGTGFFYINRKNKKKGKGEKKLSVTKYDPIARKHVLFEEKKLSRLKKKYKPSNLEAKAAKDAASSEEKAPSKASKGGSKPAGEKAKAKPAKQAA